jgi:hypothetical protein
VFFFSFSDSHVRRRVTGPGIIKRLGKCPKVNRILEGNMVFRNKLEENITVSLKIISPHW